MIGYVIAVVAFALPFAFAASGLGRPRILFGTGAVLGAAWIAALATTAPEDARGDQVVPVWFVVGLVGLLFLIWCGGLWLGVRLRRARG